MLKKIRDRVYDKDQKPLVSIVCLTYNQEEFIADAIESFLDQETSFQVEILIHDDASSDETAEIVRSYEGKFPLKIKTVFQNENKFSISGDPEVVYMYPLAEGKYIALCEGDDYWTDRKKLEKQVAIMEGNSDYVLCVGGYTSFSQQTQDTRIVVIKKASDHETGFEFTLDDMKDKWITKTLTALIRRNTLDKFDLTVYNYRRDIHLFYHLMKNGKGFYLSENLGVYRIHSGGINSMKPSIYNSYIGYQCYKELYKNNEDEYTRVFYMRSTLSLLNYMIYGGTDHRSYLNKYIEALRLVRKAKELRWFLTVFLNRDFKKRIKERWF